MGLFAFRGRETERVVDLREPRLEPPVDRVAVVLPRGVVVDVEVQREGRDQVVRVELQALE